MIFLTGFASVELQGKLEFNLNNHEINKIIKAGLQRLRASSAYMVISLICDWFDEIMKFIIDNQCIATQTLELTWLICNFV